MSLTTSPADLMTATARRGALLPIARAISSSLGQRCDRPRMEPATGNAAHRNKPATMGTLLESRPYAIAIAAELAIHGEDIPAPSHQSRRSTRIRNQHSQKPANAHIAVKPPWNTD